MQQKKLQHSELKIASNIYSSLHTTHNPTTTHEIVHQTNIIILRKRTSHAEFGLVTGHAHDRIAVGGRSRVVGPGRVAQDRQLRDGDEIAPAKVLRLQQVHVIVVIGRRRRIVGRRSRYETSRCRERG